jgi:hypothetical protein
VELLHLLSLQFRHFALFVVTPDCTGLLLVVIVFPLYDSLWLWWGVDKVVAMLWLRTALAAILSLLSRWCVGVLVVRMYCLFTYMEDGWQIVFGFLAYSRYPISFLSVILLVILCFVCGLLCGCYVELDNCFLASARTSQWTQSTSVIKINKRAILSYMYMWLHETCLLRLSDFNKNGNVRTNFIKNCKWNCTKIRPVGGALFCASMWTDGQTGIC